MVFALALVLSLMLAAALASIVTAPLRRIARATQAMAKGDLGTRVPVSRLEELGALAQAFNHMAARLKASFDDLVGEVEMRKTRERELEQSEGRLRTSEDRLQLAIEGAAPGIWDWDVEHDRLVWDESMYRLYGVRKEEFTGAFDAWSRCLVPEDVAYATGEIAAALRGDREYACDFRVRREDGAIRTIRAVHRRFAWTAALCAWSVSTVTSPTGHRGLIAAPVDSCAGWNISRRSWPAATRLRAPRTRGSANRRRAPSWPTCRTRSARR